MINILKTDQDIITLSIDDREQETNVLNERFITHFETLVEEITRDDSVKGLIITSSKKDFLLDHDLTAISQMENTLSIFEYISKLQSSLDMLEQWGKPVVAAISGPAHGAGLEVALACHYRVVINHHTVSLKLNSDHSGLIPSLGTIQRLTRSLGIAEATQLLLNPLTYNPQQAWEIGLIDALADTNTLMLEMACAWIEQNPSPSPRWAFDNSQDPNNPKKPTGKKFFRSQSDQLFSITMGLNPAKSRILERVYDGAYTAFQHACRADAESFANLFKEPMSKNRINVLHFGIEDCKKWAKQKSKGVSAHSKIAIINPSKIASQLVMAIINTGIEVSVTCDDITTGEAFKNLIAKSLQERVESGHITKDSKDFKLSQLEVFDTLENLKGCSLVIKCDSQRDGLIESLQRIEEKINEDTPLLIITDLSSKIEDISLQASNPQNWLGINFSNLNSTSDIIELKRGPKTSGSSIVKSLKLIHDIGKTPIVLNDQRGSFSLSLKMAYIHESLICLSEGVDPYAIERSTLKTGMTSSPFQLMSEIGQEELLGSLLEIQRAHTVRPDETYSIDALEHIIRFFKLKLESNKSKADLFYERKPNGEIQFSSPSFDGLIQDQLKIEEAKRLLPERLLLIQVSKALSLIEQKAIQSPIEADLASILTAHFPAYSGGILSYIQFHGAKNLIEKYEKLESNYGKRFRVPKILKQLDSRGLSSIYEIDQYFYSNRIEQED
jgi:3-hydroxyacyl-CoA dehydrogenase/enoyl-CoA hydratase/3-hydroxybutyryl-CoA epimerase